MAHSTSLLNLTIGYSYTTEKRTTNPRYNLEFCRPFQRAVFETVDSSVPYLVNAALNVPLAITTTFANLMVLLAIGHIASIRLPSKLLLCTLALTDLGIGLVVQPQYAVFLLMKASNPYSVNCFMMKSVNFTGLLLSSVSLLTMTAISLDRYTALFFHIKYQQIVTTKRVVAILTFMWSFSILYASAIFWLGSVLWTFIGMSIFVICFLVISVTYIKIYRGLRGQHGHHVQPEAGVQDQQQTANMLNLMKYKRIASTLLWICALFTLCYAPWFCMFVTQPFEHTALIECISEFALTILLLNSCLNPLVYFLRLPEIRAEVLKQLREFCCRSP